jgi:uncharacterized protein
MRRARTIVILVAMAITMLFVWQANTPAFAKAPAPTCRGTNLLEAMQTKDPKGYADLLAREKAIVNGKGLLWKIERPGTATSYLYGTMHMSDDRLTTLPGPVADALDEAGTVALELEEIVDEAKMNKAVIRNLGLLTFTDGRTLDSVLAGDNLRLLKKTLKRYSMPYASTRIMKPWFVMLSLSMPLCEIERQKVGLKALDKTIAETAQKNGAKIVGLESVREQFAVFASLSEKFQKEFLLSTLRQHHQLDDQIETMKQLYLQRRSAALWEFALYVTRKDVARNNGNRKQAFDELAALKKFESELVIKRNKVMHDRSLPLLEKGNLFIAVGAAHLPGKTGLVSLLRKSGYKVSVVY